METVTQTDPKLPAGSNLCKSLTSELAAQINKHHRLAYRHATKAIEHARQAGELLIKAKFEIPHGGWLPWLEANCDVGEREAQRYMRLSRRWDELKSDTVTDLSIRGALEYLTKHWENHEEPINRAFHCIPIALEEIGYPGVWDKLESGEKCSLSEHVALILAIRISEDYHLHSKRIIEYEISHGGQFGRVLKRIRKRFDLLSKELNDGYTPMNADMSRLDGVKEDGSRVRQDI